MRHFRAHLWPLLVILTTVPQSKAAEPARPQPFLEAKTCFQTNSRYDPRLAIAVDAVIVHRHGDNARSLAGAIGSWKRRGFSVGRMFFADSDATNAYWQGQWDGTPHPEDVETNADGKHVLCAGVRPYMLPTEGWIRYLEEMAVMSIDAGADAVLPEEPLAHANTGYEQSFRELWKKRYGKPWQPENASAEAHFLTARLKNELYATLEARLARVTKAKAREVGREVAFVLPVHSQYSNVAAHLVAPLGTSLSTPQLDGYIGQVWTGPVNWALGHYNSPHKDFFGSAYALYDYFVEMTAGSKHQLWLLADPVEDDPHHTWAEFERWYRHCLVAKLLFTEADAFEVMPWPERIFLPGGNTGGQTPAPEDYRIVLLSAIQTLQEVPEGGNWSFPEAAPTEGIGIALADTLLWENAGTPWLQGTYGLLLPLIERGVPVSACILERSGDAAYLARFKVIVLSYESFKPATQEVHAHLVAWVRRGGSLVILGEPKTIDGDFWWKQQGFRSPLDHLAHRLEMNLGRDGEQPLGKGHVYRRQASPRRFADPAAAKAGYLPLLNAALQAAGVVDGLKAPGHFCLRRGPFVIAHAGQTTLKLPGKLVSILDAELPALDGATLEPGESGLYRDVTSLLGNESGEEVRVRPQVLHATHRLMEQSFSGSVLRFTLRGPAETPAVARVFTGTRPPLAIVAKDAAGKPVAVDTRQDGPTLRIKFPNQPDGAGVEVRW